VGNTYHACRSEFSVFAEAPMTGGAHQGPLVDGLAMLGCCSPASQYGAEGASWIALDLEDTKRQDQAWKRWEEVERAEPLGE